MNSTEGRKVEKQTAELYGQSTSMILLASTRLGVVIGLEKVRNL
jgi:hypothetical protein